MSELTREEIRTLMKEEFQNAKKVGQPITKASLAEKYSISKGTVRRWASEDNWDERSKKKASERSDERSEEGTNVRDQYSKYNWHELKRRFLTGNYKTLADFAKKNDLKVNGNFKKRTNGWLEEKDQLEIEKSTILIEKSIQKTTDRASDRIADVAVAVAEDICDTIGKRKNVTLQLTGEILIRVKEALAKVDVQQLKKKSITKSHLKTKVSKEKIQKFVDEKDALPEGVHVTEDGHMTVTNTTMVDDIEERLTSVDGRKLLNITKTLSIAHEVDRKVLNIDKIEKENDELNAKRKLEDYFS